MRMHNNRINPTKERVSYGFPEKVTLKLKILRINWINQTIHTAIILMFIKTEQLDTI